MPRGTADDLSKAVEDKEVQQAQNVALRARRRTIAAALPSLRGERWSSVVSSATNHTHVLTLSLYTDCSPQCLSPTTCVERCWRRSSVSAAHSSSRKRQQVRHRPALCSNTPSSEPRGKHRLRESTRKISKTHTARTARGRQASSQQSQRPLSHQPSTKKQRPATHKKHKPNQPAGAASTGAQPLSSSSTLSSLSAKLVSSRFRWLNEQLYTLPSAAAFAHFSSHPADYSAYHAGFRQQVQRWPSHPLDLIIAHLQSLSTPHTIADMGCGDARIAQTLAGTQHTVHSFDLVPHSHLVTQCNIRHTPLSAHSVDTLVYCLSLMPTDYHELLSEAMRVLRPGGELIVAEVSSRLVAGGGVEGLVKGLEAMGMKRRKVIDNDYFALVWCTKESGDSKTEKAGGKVKQRKGSSGSKKVESKVKVVLTPCIYKKR